MSYPVCSNPANPAAAPFGFAPPRASVGLAAVGGLVVVLLLLIPFRGLAAQLIDVWRTHPDWSHGPFVPLVAATFAWMAIPSRHRAQAWSVDAREMKRGLLLGTLGLLAFIITWFINSLWGQTLTLILVLLSVVRMLTGAQGSRAFRFPCCFLIFMAPVPGPLYQSIATTLQQVVTQVTTLALQLLGIPALQTGNVVQLPGYALEVGQACSGLRQLTALVALAAVLGYLSGRPRTFRFVLLLAAIPVALVANWIRAVATGLVVVLFGPQWAEGPWHTGEGLVLISLATLLLMAVAILLTRLRGERWNHSPLQTDRREARVAGQPFSLARRLTLVCVFLMVVAGVQFGLERWASAWERLAPQPLVSTVAATPLSIGDWEGRNLPITEATWQYADQHLQRVYRDTATGQSVWVWLAYSATGKDRCHHPQVCQTVAGKQEERTARQQVNLGGATDQAQRMRFGDGTQAQEIYYWHYTLPLVGGENVSPLARLYLSGHRPGASLTVEVAAVAGSQTAAVERFVAELAQTLRTQIVGPDAVCGNDQLPITIVRTE